MHDVLEAWTSFYRFRQTRKMLIQRFSGKLQCPVKQMAKLFDCWRESLVVLKAEAAEEDWQHKIQQLKTDMTDLNQKKEQELKELRRELEEEIGDVREEMEQEVEEKE